MLPSAAARFSALVLFMFVVAGAPVVLAAPTPQDELGHEFVPPELEHLQEIKTYGPDAGISDDIPTLEISLEMRREAQREAALSYGARGGLSKRNYQISERLKGYEGGLDQVFRFRALLIRAPSGMLIEPPIVSEALDTIKVTQRGAEAAVADRIYNINKEAAIVTAPRDWRHYLVQDFGAVAPPPKILWPANAQEQIKWDQWVAQGWRKGFEQADEIFEANLNRLVADFDGMVRYRMLLAQGMISQPYALHEDRGVTGDQATMRVGDRALRITGPSRFQTGSETWKPADR